MNRTPIPAPTPGDVMPMTCALDKHDHAVTAESFAEGRGLGVYLAVCGWMVEAASMSCAPGPPCPLCVRVLNPRPVSIPVQRSARRGGLGALVRRLHHGSAA